jgi:hypothetical protein
MSLQTAQVSMPPRSDSLRVYNKKSIMHIAGNAQLAGFLYDYTSEMVLFTVSILFEITLNTYFKKFAPIQEDK